MPMLRVRVLALVLVATLLVSCGGTAPAPAPRPEPETPAAATPERPEEIVYVTASTLNVRREATTTSAVVTRTKKGERLVVTEHRGDWIAVRVPAGPTGWVSAQHVSSAPPPAAAARPRRPGCPADSDFRFVKSPTPAFFELGKHGLVVVEASVDVRGNVTATRVVSNSTGDDALAFMAEKEMKESKFAPPVRNCEPHAFIFTYKRSF